MENFDEAGAKAFAEFYWQVVNYAQATGETRLLEEVQRDSCGGCAAPRQWIEDVYSNGGLIEGGDHRPVRSRVIGLGRPGSDEPVGYSVRMTLQAASGRVYDHERSIVETSAEAKIRVHMLVSREAGRVWLIDEWEVIRS